MCGFTHRLKPVLKVTVPRIPAMPILNTFLPPIPPKAACFTVVPLWFAILRACSFTFRSPIPTHLARGEPTVYARDYASGGRRCDPLLTFLNRDLQTPLEDELWLSSKDRESNKMNPTYLLTFSTKGHCRNNCNCLGNMFLS